MRAAERRMRDPGDSPPVFLQKEVEETLTTNVWIEHVRTPHSEQGARRGCRAQAPLCPLLLREPPACLRRFPAGGAGSCLQRNPCQLPLPAQCSHQPRAFGWTGILHLWEVVTILILLGDTLCPLSEVHNIDIRLLDPQRK